eukprot:TRINITY_DN21901_c0_g1_i1.p2 TRINITY_DN21901_c0_g1~~TRINITY_DN21901_c0_g1_i1.p2  ORF type:complete len:62 (+),score=3.49 TRINITY_DN21901_c0_g1_i1:95-280(+)
MTAVDPNKINPAIHGKACEVISPVLGRPFFGSSVVGGGVTVVVSVVSSLVSSEVSSEVSSK